ncbi:MAG: alpha/beta hydrolase [Caulobacterales bacterium]|nr:alpha/beta hydrolase [Caulobacterales bacterium]
MYWRIIAAVVVLAVVPSVSYWWTARDLEPSVVEARYVTASDRFLVIDGTRTRVREEGRVDSQTVVLVHGFTDSLETWDGWAAELTDQYQIVRYDLRGHGLTGPDPDKRYDIDARAAFLGEVLDALGLERAAVGGSGLGGYVAWKYAHANPSRVDRLVLVAPMAFPYAGVGPEPNPTPGWMTRVPKLAPWWGWPRVVDTIYADPGRAGPEVEQRRRAMGRRQGNAVALVEHAMAQTVPADPGPQLAEIAAPILLLWGAWDAILSEDQVDEWREALPDVHAIVFPDLGHVPHQENPEVTAAVVSAFLRGQMDPR